MLQACERVCFWSSTSEDISVCTRLWAGRLPVGVRCHVLASCGQAATVQAPWSQLRMRLLLQVTCAALRRSACGIYLAVSALGGCTSPASACQLTCSWAFRGRAHKTVGTSGLIPHTLSLGCGRDGGGSEGPVRGAGNINRHALTAATMECVIDMLGQIYRCAAPSPQGPCATAIFTVSVHDVRALLSPSDCKQDVCSSHERPWLAAEPLSRTQGAMLTQRIGSPTKWGCEGQKALCPVPNAA